MHPILKQRVDGNLQNQPKYHFKDDTNLSPADLETATKIFVIMDITNSIGESDDQNRTVGEIFEGRRLVVEVQCKLDTLYNYFIK